MKKIDRAPRKLLTILRTHDRRTRTMNEDPFEQAFRGTTASEPPLPSFLSQRPPRPVRRGMLVLMGLAIALAGAALFTAGVLVGLGLHNVGDSEVAGVPAPARVGRMTLADVGLSLLEPAPQTESQPLPPPTAPAFGDPPPIEAKGPEPPPKSTEIAIAAPPLLPTAAAHFVAPPPAAPPPRRSIWLAVQVGAFREPANAAALAEHLSRNGYEPRIVPPVRPKSRLHRVQIGRYARPSEARPTRRSLFERGLETVLVAVE